MLCATPTPDEFKNRLFLSDSSLTQGFKDSLSRPRTSSRKVVTPWLKLH